MMIQVDFGPSEHILFAGRVQHGSAASRSSQVRWIRWACVVLTLSADMRRRCVLLAETSGPWTLEGSRDIIWLHPKGARFMRLYGHLHAVQP